MHRCGEVHRESVGIMILITLDSNVLVIHDDKIKTYNDAKMNPDALMFFTYYGFKV